MPDKQIVFRVMEPTRGQAALLAASLPSLLLPYQLLVFPTYFLLARASSYPHSRQKEGQQGRGQGHRQFAVKTIERVWTGSQQT